MCVKLWDAIGAHFPHVTYIALLVAWIAFQFRPTRSGIVVISYSPFKLT